jgi:hypothetical protein
VDCHRQRQHGVPQVFLILQLNGQLLMGGFSKLCLPGTPGSRRDTRVKCHCFANILSSSLNRPQGRWCPGRLCRGHHPPTALLRSAARLTGAAR